MKERHRMEAPDYEALILGDKPITITQYATYVLSHPGIKQALIKINAYKDTADRMIDSINGMMDIGLLPIQLYNADEQAAVVDMIKDMEGLKQVALNRISESLRPNSPSRFLFSALCGFVDKDRNKDTLRELSITVFKEFTYAQPYRHFLLTGLMPFNIQRGSAMTMGREEEVLTVFSMFIWQVMYHKYENIFGFPMQSPQKSTPQNMFMCKSRSSFLETHAKYIRLDNNGPLHLLLNTPTWGTISVDDEACLDQEYASFLSENRPGIFVAVYVCAFCGSAITEHDFVAHGKSICIFCFNVKK